jgi:hypothetical protein
LHDSIADFLTDVSPGPTGEILTAAIGQGDDTSSDNGAFPLIIGLVAMLASGATVFGQIERGGNRLYGIEEDRPIVAKFGRAIAMRSSSRPRHGGTSRACRGSSWAPASPRCCGSSRRRP